ncbi:hypothetical protein [Acidianus ambivalens]|uniref:Uncharacterized protein n=1 Tax=Acidianus ambivalens TaxID=2283 RepID=A0A650CX61_ACIAM|nr:hypothetical protein [Acidianus ambivalens]MQL56336.1 hypothetical protein [Acidianus ambivalens]QGR22037.1 hypothetical protein D1866_08530 [Acidianus ambivalens]
MKFICFNGGDKYSHTRCGWFFPKGVTVCGFTRDSVEAQGLRIDIKYYEARTPTSLVTHELKFEDPQPVVITFLIVIL